MRTAASLLASAILCGCGAVSPTVAPTQASMGSADYGAAPANYEQIVRGYYAKILKDPDSAMYHPSSTPIRFWAGDATDRAGTFGYLVCSDINAKNSYGGYVGYRRDGFLIRNGEISKVLKGGEYAGKNQCAGR